MAITRRHFALTLLLLAFDVLSGACAEAEPEGKAAPPRDEKLEMSLDIAPCTLGRESRGTLEVSQMVERVGYECQLGWCSKGGCNEDNAYRRYTSAERVDVLTRIVSARCSSGCEVDIDRSSSTTRTRPLGLRGSLPGLVTVSVELETVIDGVARRHALRTSVICSAPGDAGPDADLDAGVNDGGDVTDGGDDAADGRGDAADG